MQAKQVLLFFLVFLLSIRIVIDTDFGWHLKAGQFIAATKSIPYHDLFSFTQPNYPYVYHSWAGEVFLFLAYQAGNLWGVTLFYAAVSTVAIFFIYKTCALFTKGKVNWLIILYSSLIFNALVVGSMRIFGLLFLSILYYLYTKSQKENSKAFWLAPIVMLLWANFHGSFILGLATLTIFCLLNFKKEIIVVTVTSAAATLINPYGIRTWQQAFSMFGNATLNLQSVNQDWKPLLLQDPITYILVAIILVILGVAKYRKIKLDRFQTTLVLIFLVLSLLQVRFTFALYVFFIPIANLLISKLEIKHFIVKSSIASATAIVLLTATLYVLEAKIAYNSVENYEKYISDKFTNTIKFDIWPYDAGMFLKNNNLTSKNLLAEANSASFLIFQNQEQKVFYWGAMDNFFIEGKPFVFQYLDLVNTKPGWPQQLEKYNVEVVLLPKTYPLIAELAKSSDWQKAYEGQDGVIYFNSRSISR